MSSPRPNEHPCVTFCRKHLQEVLKLLSREKESHAPSLKKLKAFAKLEEDPATIEDFVEKIIKHAEDEIGSVLGLLVNIYAMLNQTSRSLEIHSELKKYPGLQVTYSQSIADSANEIMAHIASDLLLKKLVLIDDPAVRAFLAKAWGVDLRPLEAKTIYISLNNGTLDWSKCPLHLQSSLADIFCEEVEAIEGIGIHQQLQSLLDCAERKTNLGKALHGTIAFDQKTEAELKVQAKIEKLLTPHREKLKSDIELILSKHGWALVPYKMQTDHMIKTKLLIPCLGRGNDLIEASVHALVKLEGWETLKNICEEYLNHASPWFPVDSLYAAIKKRDHLCDFIRHLVRKYNPNHYRDPALSILLDYIERDNVDHFAAMLEATVGHESGEDFVRVNLYTLCGAKTHSVFISAAITCNLMDFVNDSIAPRIRNTFDYGRFPKPALSQGELKLRLIKIRDDKLRSTLIEQWGYASERLVIEAEAMYPKLYENNRQLCELPKEFNRDYQPFLTSIALRHARARGTTLEKYAYLMGVISLDGCGLELYRQNQSKPKGMLSKALHATWYGFGRTDAVKAIEDEIDNCRALLQAEVESVLKELDELCKAIDDGAKQVHMAGRIKDILLIPFIFEKKDKLRAGIRALFKLGNQAVLVALYDNFVDAYDRTSLSVNTHFFKAIVDYDASLDFDRLSDATAKHLADASLADDVAPEDDGFMVEREDESVAVSGSLALDVRYNFIVHLAQINRTLKYLPIHHNKYVLEQLLEQSSADRITFERIFGSGVPSPTYIAVAIGLNRIAHLNDITKLYDKAYKHFVTPALRGDTLLKYRLAGIENPALRNALANAYGVGAQRVEAVRAYYALRSEDEGKRSEAAKQFNTHLQELLAEEVLDNARKMDDLKAKLRFLTEAISQDLNGKPINELAGALLATLLGYGGTKAAGMIAAVIANTRKTLLDLFYKENGRVMNNDPSLDKEACAKEMLEMVILPGIFEDITVAEAVFFAFYKLKASREIQWLIQNEAPLWALSTPKNIRQAFFRQLIMVKEDEYDRYIVELSKTQRDLQDIPIQEDEHLLKMILNELKSDLALLATLPNRIFTKYRPVPVVYIKVALELGLLDHVDDVICLSVFNTESPEPIKSLAEMIIEASKLRRQEGLDNDEEQLAFLDKTIATVRMEGDDPTNELSRLLHRKFSAIVLIRIEREQIFSALIRRLNEAIVAAKLSPSDATINHMMSALAVPLVAKTVMHDFQKIHLMLRLLSASENKNDLILDFRSKVFHRSNRHYQTPTVEFIAALIILDEVALVNSMIGGFTPKKLLVLQTKVTKEATEFPIPDALPHVTLPDLDKRVAALGDPVLKKTFVIAWALPSAAIVSLALHSDLVLHDLNIQGNKVILREILQALTGKADELEKLVGRLFLGHVSPAYLEVAFELALFPHINWIIDNNKLYQGLGSGWQERLAGTICRAADTRVENGTDNRLDHYEFLATTIRRRDSQTLNAISRVLHKGLTDKFVMTNAVYKIQAKMEKLLPVGLEAWHARMVRVIRAIDLLNASGTAKGEAWDKIAEDMEACLAHKEVVCKIMGEENKDLLKKVLSALFKSTKWEEVHLELYASLYEYCGKRPPVTYVMAMLELDYTEALSAAIADCPVTKADYDRFPPNYSMSKAEWIERINKLADSPLKSLLLKRWELSVGVVSFLAAGAGNGVAAVQDQDSITGCLAYK